MSANFEPLSVGNVVSAGLRLYRSHLKDYFLLALKAYLWVLLPVYGWAKFYALTSLISRLAFGELINQPESISSGKRFVNSRLWDFLGAMLLMLLISLGILFGAGILFTVVAALSAALLGGTSLQTNLATTIAIILSVFVLGIVVLTAILWLFTRFYLVDVCLGIEDNMSAASSIGRSWELTQGNVWRIFLIGFVAFLITLPLQIVVQILSTIIQLAFTPLIQNTSIVYFVLYFLIILAISIASGAAIIPFWKIIQSVIYYDLRSRREGLGLTLRDHDI